MTTPILVRRVLHTIHAVRDVHAARKLYQDVFGALAFAERYHAGEDRDMALLYAADHMVEPMAPRRPNAPDTTLSRYLARFGQGLHSFELRIDDAPAAAALCRAQGLALSTVYPPFFFVKPESTGGILVELCGKRLENDPWNYRGWRPGWIEGHPSSLRRLRHIACVVRDLDRARRFFLEILSGETVGDDRLVAPQPAHQLRVRLGDLHVALIAPDDPDAGPLGVYLRQPASGVFALVWEVDDPDKARAHMQRVGMPLAPPLLATGGFALNTAAMLGARHEFVPAG